MHLGKTYSDPGLLDCGLHRNYALCQHDRNNSLFAKLAEKLADPIEARSCPLDSRVYFHWHRPGPGVIEDRVTYHAARFLFPLLNIADANYDHWSEREEIPKLGFRQLLCRSVSCIGVAG